MTGTLTIPELVDRLVQASWDYNDKDDDMKLRRKYRRARKDLEGRFLSLAAAGREVLDGLNYRIDLAGQIRNPSQPIPVFNGIAALHDALGAVES